MNDLAICPRCGKVTDVTFEEAANDPNEWSECNHCGCEFDAYHAEYQIEERREEIDDE